MKPNLTREEKFKMSLEAWENETRPFIRDKENKVRDAFDYKRKEDHIKEMKEEVAKETGDDLEHIHIWVNNNLESQTGWIKEWTKISD